MLVKQAANVLDLLDYFARRQKPATLAEIADEIGWPRSSTFNLVTTLADRGFLYEPRAREGYYPTPRWLSLSRIITEAEPLPEALHALAAEIGAETNETTAIGAPAGVQVVFLDVVESTQPIRYFARIGDRVPIYASSAGRALLSQMTPQERQSIYRKSTFEKFSDATPVSAEAIEAELAAANTRGYQQSHAEFVPDLAGVSLPLTLAQRRLCIVVAGPASRCLERRPQIATLIQRAIARFARETLR